MEKLLGTFLMSLCILNMLKVKLFNSTESSHFTKCMKNINTLCQGGNENILSELQFETFANAFYFTVLRIQVNNIQIQCYRNLIEFISITYKLFLICCFNTGCNDLNVCHTKSLLKYIKNLANLINKLIFESCLLFQ